MVYLLFIILSDILWADPCEYDEEAPATEWKENLNRGCSYIYG